MSSVCRFSPDEVVAVAVPGISATVWMAVAYTVLPAKAFEVILPVYLFAVALAVLVVSVVYINRRKEA